MKNDFIIREWIESNVGQIVRHMNDSYDICNVSIGAGLFRWFLSSLESVRMTKWRGSHFRSMGVNGESIVTVKSPWVKDLSLWATQRWLFCKSSVPGDSTPQGQRQLDDVADIAFALWANTSQCSCWVFSSHFGVFDSQQEAAGLFSESVLWRFGLWKAHTLRSHPRAVPGDTWGTAVPVLPLPFTGLTKPLKNEAQHFHR